MENASTHGGSSSLCILVLDDEAQIRDLYIHHLSRQGHEVIPAATGHEALQYMMQHRFDVLIVDIFMPEMSGVTFLQEALKIWPWVGVCVISGFVTPALVAQLNELGVTRILHKPISHADLVREVQEAATEKPPPSASLTGGSLMALMKDHLKLLSHVDETALGSGSLVDALSEFGRDLAAVLPCDALGLLVVEENNPVLVVHLRRAVNKRFIDSIGAETFKRYRAISGKSIDESSLAAQIDGEQISKDAPENTGAMLSVPIILGQDVCGMLTLATTDPAPYSPTDVSLLYHAANHVSAVFMALRRMRHLATHDVLTGLFNRKRIEEDMERTWNYSQRYDLPMSLVVIDIDHYKVMNDTYGHAVGDEVLRDFAGIMRQTARNTDILARFGGDEFLAILPHTSLPEAQSFGDRLVNRIREHCFCPDTHRVMVTTSVGVAASDNHSHPASAAELLVQADKALYMAKREGRDRVHAWTGDLIQAVAAPDEPAMHPAGMVTPGSARAHVLVVDDEEQILKFMNLLLTKEGYDVKICSSAEDALGAVKDEPLLYDIVLTDITMPGMTGIELLNKISEADPLIMKIAMSGYTTVDTVVNCLRAGAIDFIQKPVESRYLLSSIRRAMIFRSLKLENIYHQSHLERMVEQRSTQLTRMLQDVKSSYEYTLEAFMAILDAREQQTGRHSLRVRELTIWLARRMNIAGQELEEIATGALLHDIGKIAIPDRVLLSSGPLPPEEWRVMKTHAELGFRILTGNPRLAGAARIVIEHHEHFNGQGYPKGLRGEEICLGARIFAVVDAYDAMRSERSYQAAKSEEETTEEIIASSGTQFDPAVIQVFLKHRKLFAQWYERLIEDPSLPPTVLQS